MGPIVGLLLAIEILLFSQWPMQTHALVIDLSQPSFRGGHTLSAGNILGGKRGFHLFSVAADGTVQVNGDAIHKDALPEIIQGHLTERPAPHFFFEADRDAAYGDILPVLDQLRHAGLSQSNLCLRGLAQFQHFDKAWQTVPMRLTLHPMPLPPPQGPFLSTPFTEPCPQLQQPLE